MWWLSTSAWAVRNFQCNSPSQSWKIFITLLKLPGPGFMPQSFCALEGAGVSNLEAAGYLFPMPLGYFSTLRDFTLVLGQGQEPGEPFRNWSLVVNCSRELDSSVVSASECKYLKVKLCFVTKYYLCGEFDVVAVTNKYFVERSLECCKFCVCPVWYNLLVS